MSRSRTINLRAPRLRDLHAHLHAAATGSDTLARVVAAAFSSEPGGAVDAEVRAIAAEAMSSDPATTRKAARQRRLGAPRFDSRASCLDGIDLRISFTVKGRPRHRKCSHSCTRVQVLENGEVVYEKPKRRVARLSLPSNGPSSRNFRDGMVQRGWEAHLMLYRALARIPERFAWRDELHQNAWSVETALCRHESNFGPFIWCVPLRQCLAAGDFDGASGHAHCRLEQLLERRIEDRKELLEAARTMRNDMAARIFQGSISFRERSGFASALDRLFCPVAASDVIFRGMFIALTAADSCAQGFAEAAPADAPAPLMNSPFEATDSQPHAPSAADAVASAPQTDPSLAAPAAHRKAQFRRPTLGQGLRPLLGATADVQPELVDPRRWVLCNLEKLQQSLLHDWEATLYCVRDFLVVLDIGNAQKLDALLSGPHESNWRAIRAAALQFQRLIDEAQRELDVMNGVVLKCTRSIENRTESVSQAIAVLHARDAFTKANQRVRAVFNASAKELNEDLQVLERAQAQHVSRELDALVQFIEDRPQVERGLKMRRLLSDLHRMREIADTGMRWFLAE